jgi:hypothetical protein
MMAALTLYTKLETLPPELKKEASDFIDFLIQKKSKREKEKTRKPVFGSLRGKIQLSEDFDAPLDVFNDYM